MIDCKVCCKICEQTLCRYAGTQRELEVDCRYYTPRQKPQTNADRIRDMSEITGRGMTLGETYALCAVYAVAVAAVLFFMGRKR